MTGILSQYRREEQDALTGMRRQIAEIEAKLAICDAAAVFAASPIGQNYILAVNKLRDAYVRAAMQEDRTAPLQRAAALEEQLQILMNARSTREALARELEEAKNHMRLSTVTVGGEERLDPSGGIWR